MAEGEDAKREKWRNMYREDGDMKLDANRRAGSVGSKRGAEIYRPGCGLYPPRSPRGELEDNMSNSNSNLYSASMSSEKRHQDSEGSQNGPSHGSHSQSRGGNGRRSGHSGRSRSGRVEKSDGRNNRDIKDPIVSKLSERLAVVTLKRDESQQSHGSDSVQPEGTLKAVQNIDSVRRTKKPEQQIYIPKPIAQSMANKEAASKLSNNNREGTDYTDDDSASYCAEDDSRAGNSQGGRDGSKRKAKKKRKGKRGDHSDRSEGGHSNGKPAQDTSSRGGNSQRQDHPRSNQDMRTDNQSGSGIRSGLDSKAEPPRSSNKSESVNARLTQWTNDNRSDSSNRGGSVSNAMTRSMIDQRRNNDEVHKFDDASMTQSWHADVPSGRNVRLGSEPRGGAPGSMNMDNARSRDSRSVEPSSWNADKVQAKPPSGRRGSGKDIVYSSGNNSKPQSRLKEADVPPRFRKKQSENGVREPPVYNRENTSSQAPQEKGRYIGTTSEETWDGSTVTFQGSHGPQSSQNNFSGQYHSLPSMSLPPTPVNSQPNSLPPTQPQEQWSNTMPTSRPRGRGRLRAEEMERRYNQPGGLDSYSVSSSVESLAHPPSRSDREWSSKHPPSMSTPALSAHGHNSNHQYPIQALPLPGPLRRRPSSGSLHGDRSGRRTPTGRHTPTDSGRTTPVNYPSSDHDAGKVPSPAQPKIMDISDIVVPEIEDWCAEVERSEQLQGSASRPPSDSRVDILSSPCQDWNEEVERAEQLQGSSCSIPSKPCLDHSSSPSQDRKNVGNEGSPQSKKSVSQIDLLDVPHQDWCEEVERSERLEASAAQENHVRSPSPVSRPTDNVQWKKPQPTADWKKPRRSASGERPPSRSHEGHERPNSRGPSRDHSMERGGGGPRSGGRPPGAPAGPGGPWRRDASADRSQGNSDHASWRNDREQPAWRRDHSQERGEGREGRDGRVWRPAPGLNHGPAASAHGAPDHSGDRGRARQNSGRDQDRGQAPEHGRRDHSPHERRNGPEPPAGGRNRRTSGRDHSGERGGGRNRRNSGRDHSGERGGGGHRRHSGRDHSHERGGPAQGHGQGRHRKNSGRDHSHERERDRGRNRRNSGRDHSRDRRDHSREGAGGGSRRERMGLEWRHRDREGIDDDWRRPTAAAAGAAATKQSPPQQKAPGILVLPQDSALPTAAPAAPTQQPSYPPQRHLYDPSNPNKPIIVVNPSVRAATATPSSNGLGDSWSQNHQPVTPAYQQFESSSVFAPPHFHPSASLVANQFGSIRPAWYDPYSENFRTSSQPHLILDIEKADWELHCMINSGKWLENWTRIEYIRKFIQNGFDTFVLNDIRFLHRENADQHLWKILFYNFIEILRKSIAEGSPDIEPQKKLLLQVIDQGTQFFESLLLKLQDKYSFRLDDYLSGSETGKLTAQTAVAILVAQKIYLFLGDLARYREQANETSSYGKARQWYIKAHQVNPKSGRPYNQLAILAVYARRKIDAVYYYMRGLMSSNMVVHTARENLLSLFDENSKKYEQTEKKRREDREAKDRSRMMEKEGKAGPPSLRREFWYHPNNGQRVSRTTSNTLRADYSDTEEELAKLKNVDLNKRFVMSFLHIHGKLFTKVGMETFQIAAVQMLKEFYALLQHSPIPLTATRFLQLLALNMFAIENTKLKDVEAGYRSAAQEAALVVSLQMFSVLLERCVALLRDQVSRGARHDLLVEQDVVALLPAVKIWCDWLTCHQEVWNPPPAAADYHVGPPGDTWTRLAALVNLLDTLDADRAKLAEKPIEGYSQVRLPEDATLAGFMPLMTMTQGTLFAPRDMDPELVHVCARIRRLQFFGHIILCGIDPPVLRLHKDEMGRSEYVSVAARSAGHRQGEDAVGGDGAASPADSLSDDELLDVDLEEEDEEAEGAAAKEVADKELLTPSENATADEVRALLLRREQLEKHRRQQERHRKRVQDIIRQSAVEVEIEVRPHFIVPDTNCFVDHLDKLKQLAAGQTLQLMVPIVVVGELEGLQRGGARPGPGGLVDTSATASAHADRVARSAKEALAFLRQRPGPPSLRCVTTKGSTLASTVFTQEDDGQQDMMNDDKILATCLNLSRTSSKDEVKAGEPRRLVRDVVLLTDDRNLRVKALSRDVPVRELPDFMRWANLG